MNGLAVISRLPSALQKNLPVIRATEMPPALKLLVVTGNLQPGTAYYRMGKACIILSPPTETTGWHLSISRDDRYPNWDEVVGSWYGLVPGAAEREGVMHLPPISEYINIHEYCFQIHELLTP